MISTIVNRRSLFKIIAAFMMSMMLFLSMSVVNSYADVNIKVKGASDLQKGAGYTVTVVFSGDDLGRVDGQATYDTSKLSYVSGGSSSGDNGYIELKEAGTGEDITFKLKFKAIGAGSTDIKITTNGVYNLEEEIIGTPSSSQSVDIAEEDVTEPEEETTETTEAETSSDIQDEQTTVATADPAADPADGMPGILKIIFGIAAAALLALIIVIIVSLTKKKGKH